LPAPRYYSDILPVSARHCTRFDRETPAPPLCLRHQRGTVLYCTMCYCDTVLDVSGTQYQVLQSRVSGNTGHFTWCYRNTVSGVLRRHSSRSYSYGLRRIPDHVILGSCTRCYWDKVQGVAEPSLTRIPGQVSRRLSTTCDWDTLSGVTMSVHQLLQGY
jgi:hypothetical protein